MPSQNPDVAVIGGGIVGLAIAWRLSQRGLHVTVFDAGRAGHEASWAGAGMLAPGGEVESASEWANLALESLGMYAGFVAELREESGESIDFRQCGATDIAFTADEWTRLQLRAGRQRAVGIVSDTADARPWNAEAALFYPNDAVVDPRDVVQALLTSCRQRGVEIREHERVLRVSPIGIETEAGLRAAGAAILSAGAWSGEIEIWGAAIPATFPLRGHLVGGDLAPGSLPSLVRHGHTYLLQRSNGFTIAGSSVERTGFNRTPDPEIARAIENRATALLPAFANAANKTTWIGFRPATENLEPQIRKLEGCPVWLAYGHYRNGILLAPATAARIAAEVTSGAASRVTSNWEKDWSSLHACR